MGARARAACPDGPRPHWTRRRSVAARGEPAGRGAGARPFPGPGLGSRRLRGSPLLPREPSFPEAPASRSPSLERAARVAVTSRPRLCGSRLGLRAAAGRTRGRGDGAGVSGGLFWGGSGRGSCRGGARRASRARSRSGQGTGSLRHSPDGVGRCVGSRRPGFAPGTASPSRRDLGLGTTQEVLTGSEELNSEGERQPLSRASVSPSVEEWGSLLGLRYFTNP